MQFLQRLIDSMEYVIVDALHSCVVNAEDSTFRSKEKCSIEMLFKVKKNMLF